MAKRGAKTKYTPELQAKLCEILSSGNYIEAACAYVGISKDTFYDWKEKFPQFSDAVEKARSGAEIASVARIRKAGAEGTWQADAWFLERSYQDRWGRTRQEITGKDGGPIILKGYANVSPDEWDNGNKD